MSEYTAEQVELMADWAAHLADPVRYANPKPASAWPGDTAAGMLCAYAALLRSRERGKRGVTDEIVERAIDAYERAPGVMQFAAMRAALEAVWPVEAQP